MPKDERARSAIEEIYAISEQLKTIEKQILIIDNNIKLLNNKVSKLSKQKESVTAKAPVATPAVQAAPVSKTPSATVPARSKDLVIGDIKVFGYVVSKNRAPIKGVNVKVYNEGGEIIKEKTTNDDGYWSARLPPGRYGVEYNHQFGKRKFKPINRTIELTDRTREFEVT
nr:hypothetical protein 91 [bacterium]